MSPNFDENAYLYGQGFAIVADPEMITEPVRMLAVPNLCLFIIGFLAAIWLTLVVPIGAQWHRGIATGLTAWYVLEVGRWFEALWQFSKLTANSPLGDLLTYLVFMALLLPAAFTFYAVRPVLRVEKRHG